MTDISGNALPIAGERSTDSFASLGRLIFLAGLMVSAFDHAVLQNASYTPTVFVLLGVALFLLGLTIYFTARLTLGMFFSEKVRIRPDHKLITKGPYRIVRHPIYLGEILYFISIPVIFSSLYGLVIMLVIIPMLLRRIRIEEMVLNAKFGKEFEEYASKTKKLIPFIY